MIQDLLSSHMPDIQRSTTPETSGYHKIVEDHRIVEELRDQGTEKISIIQSYDKISTLDELLAS